ncbi:hypothetical protein A0U40_04815 [[Bacillus] sp. KCTC 13219]|nr:hypothetical protein A0U40_04815 [[Bacillus] sp. KCTC 13219]
MLIRDKQYPSSDENIDFNAVAKQNGLLDNSLYNVEVIWTAFFSKYPIEQLQINFCLQKPLKYKLSI